MNILFVAPYKNYGARDSGYGNFSDNILKTLVQFQKEGKIKCLDTYNVLNGKHNFTKPSNEKYDVCYVITNPSGINNPNTIKFLKTIMKDAKRKYLNILWETMPLPRAWDYLWTDDLFDGFVTCSYFLIAQLQCLTKKPIYYLPYCVKSPDKVINIQEKLKEELFTVLVTGQNTIRKGVNDAIIAYSRTFNSIKNVQMVIKNFEMSRHEPKIEDKVRHLSLTNMSCQNNPIYILQDELTDEEVMEMYRMSSILLFPSRGEGFGIPCVEMMSVGGPVIYNNWSSLPEVCNSPYNIAIPYYLDSSYGMFEFGYDYGSKYAIPNISAIMKALYLTYAMWSTQREKYYTEAANNIKIITERFSYDKMSRCMDNFLNETNPVAPEDVNEENKKYLDDNTKMFEQIVKERLF